MSPVCRVKQISLSKQRLLFPSYRITGWSIMGKCIVGIRPKVVIRVLYDTLTKSLWQKRLYSNWYTHVIRNHKNPTWKYLKEQWQIALNTINSQAYQNIEYRSMYVESKTIRAFFHQHISLINKFSQSSLLYMCC